MESLKSRKRIVVCMDGTWQSLRQDRPTNIALIARSVAHKETVKNGAGEPDYIHQIVIYTQGVGANVGALPGRSFFSLAMSRFNRLAGGVFGEGLEDGILDAYMRLCFNYEEGDEIYIFGFSRGAFAARRLAGLINTSGILSRQYIHLAWEAYTLYHNAPSRRASDGAREEHEKEARRFRENFGKGGRTPDGTRTKRGDPPLITFLGVFDTVVQRGLGDVVASITAWGRNRYELKNFVICPNVIAARHAVAVDERRRAFPLTPWEQIAESNEMMRKKLNKPERTYYYQRWFVGTHGDVGGGEEKSTLSALALKWMAEGAAEMGLRFYATYGEDKSPMAAALAHADLSFDQPISRPAWWKRLIIPVHFGGPARKIWNSKQAPVETDFEGYFHSSVLQRVRAEYVRPPYNPAAMRPFRKLLKAMRAQTPG
ncbi:MAG TPA: DUF2235 domain-containing protein [Terricaulis sp.]|nr:DUF2235 domain-containing protein [Terricaulis sp.]